MTTRATLALVLSAFFLGGFIRLHAAPDYLKSISTGDAGVVGAVTWSSLGTNENDSMPIGNGDLAANVWTETNGDIVLLLAKSDAWTELGQLVKLGRVRVQLTPNPFTGKTNFRQTLRLDAGCLEIRSDNNRVQIWADANHPVIHVAAELDQPTELKANLELWRKAKLNTVGVREFERDPLQLDVASDTVFPAGKNQITWCHFNPSSVYPVVLAQEHLQSVLDKHPDPLLHGCFGAALTGSQMIGASDHQLKSVRAARRLEFDVVALTESPAASPEAWRTDLDSLANKMARLDSTQAWQAHLAWWRDFWNRSWIRLSGSAEAATVSQGWAMQRYLMACGSRGAFSQKFNGGLFTVGHDLPPGKHANFTDHDPDFRRWGNCYWNQNNRLLYWPLLATGDFDLLASWFSMYRQALPLATDRAQIYFHHAGALFPETMHFWGLPSTADFGWNNPSNEIQSRWQRYHIQGGVEVIAQMLDEYDLTQDAEFARTNLLPVADAVVTFYGEHWPRDANGRIRMAPAQSLETYQLDAVNPTPDIAGLMSVIPRLLALPPALRTPEQSARWAKILADLPPLPIGQAGPLAKGESSKMRPLGADITNGTPVILPAETFGQTRNQENPELYVTFPYRLYGVGKPGLQLARDTYALRRFPMKACWGQDGPQAAVLGLTEEAKQAVMNEFTQYGNQRFRWFWRAGNDWIPDLDNGGTGMMTLELMLMQCDGRRIQLLPAWPKDWSADFKLHAPYRTVVEGRVEQGKLIRLKVTPPARAQDVVVLPAS